MKAQWVRLFDVFVLGPSMVVAGVKLSTGAKAKGLGIFIVAAGVGTSLYNARNYARIQRRKWRIIETGTAGR